MARKNGVAQQQQNEAGRDKAPAQGEQRPASKPAAAARVPAPRSDRPQPSAAERELLDFIALVMLAIKEEIEDLRNTQGRAAQEFSGQLMELGRQLPNSPAMATIVGLMQGDDLRNQRQQHVVNALRYVEDLIRERCGRDWEPRLTDRATGWGEGLLAGQNLEQVRAHFHHYLLGPSDKPLPPETKPARADDNAEEVELF